MMRGKVGPCMLLLACVRCTWTAEYFARGENFEVIHVAGDVLEERSVSSRRHCAYLCQASASGECSAANYDASSGVCQLLSTAATRLTPLTGHDAFFRKPGAVVEGQVGMWPLNELYQGKNLVPGKTDLSLYDVTFPGSDATWMSAPAYFSGASTSYAQVNEIADVKLSDSFAFIAAVYRQDGTNGPLFEWHAGSGYSVHVWVNGDQLFINLMCGGGNYGVDLNNNQWYTLAVSYDQSTRTLSWWMDGELREMLNACSSTPGFSTANYAYVNNRPGSPARKIKGHITCMGLYNKPMTYDEMVASTNPNCQ